MGRADLGAAGDVAEAHGIRRRTEVEGAAVEDAVDRPDDRSAVRRDGRQRQQAHARQALGDLLGREPALRRVDAQQVRSRRRVAAVEQRLQRRQVVGRLVHGA
jgi:hypothetical protein